MAFIGPIVKPFLKRREAKKKIEALDQAIAEAERAYSEPFIDTLTGVERFESAVGLLDSTLLLRINTASAKDDRDQLVHEYLDKLNEEYQMARIDLKRNSASRAEVVALGLAIKEIALCLDREIASFQEHARESVSDFRRAMEDLQPEVQHRLDAEVAALEQTFKQSIALLQSQVREKADEVFADLKGYISQELAKADATHTAVIKRRTDEARQSLSKDHEKRLAAATAKLDKKVDRIREENQEQVRHLSERTAESLSQVLYAEVQQQAAEMAASIDERLHLLSGDLMRQIAEAHEEQQRVLNEVALRQDQDTRDLTASIKQVRLWTIVAFILVGFVFLLVLLL